MSFQPPAFPAPRRKGCCSSSPRKPVTKCWPGLAGAWGDVQPAPSAAPCASPAGGLEEAAEALGGRKVSISITQLILDPHYHG